MLQLAHYLVPTRCLRGVAAENLLISNELKIGTCQTILLGGSFKSGCYLTQKLLTIFLKNTAWLAELIVKT